MLEYLLITNMAEVAREEQMWYIEHNTRSIY